MLDKHIMKLMKHVKVIYILKYVWTSLCSELHETKN